MGLDPVTMAIISGATTAAQISAQNKAAQAQAQAARARTEAMYKQQEAQQQEIKAEAGAKMTEEALKRQAERGSIKAAQGESGVSGASPLRELANSYMQQAFDTGTIVSKEEAQLRTSGMQSESTYLEGVSAVNQANSSMSSPLSAMLQIGASAGTSYALAGGFSAKSALGNPAAYELEPGFIGPQRV